ncbi:MAG: glycosyltransferase family 8 protein [Kiritimatiellia bacterium]
MIGDVSISLAADHRYLPGLLATMSSIILSASQKDRLRFNVFADGLTEADCAQVAALAKRLGLSEAGVVFQHPDMSLIRKLYKPYKGSYTTFLRLFLCEFLCGDWTVYTDVDTLWFRDVCELWDERDESVSLLWSRDVPSIARGVKEYARAYCPDLEVDRYACCGVVLMNLVRMRETRLVARCADFVMKWGTPPFVDQDILNVVCLNDAKLLDQRWDCMMPDRAAVEGVVLHFNGIGRMFNGPMSGWRVLYYAWYRFYYDVVEETPDRQVCSVAKRLVFWLVGTFYPCYPLARWGLSRFGDRLPDAVVRYCFFAWLFRRAKWWGHWRMTRLCSLI